jgi:hypothetical protein
MILEPLLKVGTFGTHIAITPKGHYSFTGTVPESLMNVRGTYDECYVAFIAWFKNLDDDDKRTHGPNLRNDVFVDCWQS